MKILEPGEFWNGRSAVSRGYWTSSIKSRIFSGSGITGPITCFLRSWKAARMFLKPLLMKYANRGQPRRKFETGFMNCSGRWNLFPKKSSLMFSRKMSYVSWNPGFPIADVKSVAKYGFGDALASPEAIRDLRLSLSFRALSFCNVRECHSLKFEIPTSDF